MRCARLKVRAYKAQTAAKLACEANYASIAKSIVIGGRQKPTLKIRAVSQLNQ